MVRNGDEWIHSVDRGGSRSGRLEIKHLEAGTYAIAPSERGRDWFRPRIVELLQGEEASVTLICGAWRELMLPVCTRITSDGDLQPILLSATTASLDHENVPLPGRFASPGGVTKSSTEVAMTLYPGSFRLDLSTTRQVGSCTQIVPYVAQEWTIDVPATGGVDWPAFEVLIPSLGALAIVDGTILGSRERGGTYSFLEFETPGGGKEKFILRPDRESEGYRLIVDLDLVQGHSVDLYEMRGSRRTFIESYQLNSGKQRWDIALLPQ